MLASSCATARWTSLPVSSTTATPVGLRSPHARSSPTKYMRLACTVTCVEMSADVLEFGGQGGNLRLRVGQSHSQIAVSGRLRRVVALCGGDVFRRRRRDDVARRGVAKDRHVLRSLVKELRDVRAHDGV